MLEYIKYIQHNTNLQQTRIHYSFKNVYRNVLHLVSRLVTVFQVLSQMHKDLLKLTFLSDTYVVLHVYVISPSLRSLDGELAQLPAFVPVRDFGDDVLGFVLRVRTLCHARGQTTSFRGSDSAQTADVVVS